MATVYAIALALTWDRWRDVCMPLRSASSSRAALTIGIGIRLGDRSIRISTGQPPPLTAHLTAAPFAFRAPSCRPAAATLTCAAFKFVEGEVPVSGSAGGAT